MDFLVKHLYRPMIVFGVLGISALSAEVYYGNTPDYYSSNNEGYYDDYHYAPNECGSPAPWWNRFCGNYFTKWYIDGQFIYCRACEDGLPVAITQESPLSTTSTTADAKIQDIHFSWEPSFRIGIGADLACCACWDISLYWTHFCGRGHRNICLGCVEDTLTPAWGASFDLSNLANTVAAGETSGHWCLDLDLVDIDIGRDFCLSECFSIRPFVGVRIARIDQKFRTTTFFEVVAQQRAQAADPEARDIVRLKSLFEGAGIHLGLSGEWALGCGLSIYGEGAGSLLYGRYRIHANEAAIFGTTTGGLGTAGNANNNFLFETSDRFCKCQGIADAAIGLRWRHCVCNRLLTLQLGWEQHLFLNQNRFDDLVLNSNFVNNNANGDVIVNPGNHGFQQTRGDLCIHGVVFGAKLEF